MSNATPAQLGYRMPAEWERHAATWLTWPRPEGISFPDKYDTVPPVYAEVIRNLVPYEEVHINVWDPKMEQWVRETLRKEKTPLERVFFHHFPAYEPWCRDHGPIFVVRDGERAIVDWGYNAWGNKYPPFDLDDAIPQHVARYRNLPLFSPGIVMEGGSIEVNGQGTLLTTEACLLNPNRNPHLTRAQIETHLRNFLGVTSIIWLGEGQPMNAATMPYVVIPSANSTWNYTQKNIQLGAVVAVVYNGNVNYGVFADTGPTDIIGEASYAMAVSLGINPNPANGGTDGPVWYLVFPGSKVSPVESHTDAVNKGQVLARNYINNN